MEVYLVRHTPVDIQEGQIYGRLDVLPDASFETGCKIIQQQLPQNIQQIYSSPLRRCLMLAERLVDKEAIIQDERLKEFDYGDWEGLFWEDIAPIELQQWMDNYIEMPTPGGESLLQMKKRVIHFWEDYISKFQNGSIVCTHAGVIRIILAELDSISLEKIFDIQVGYGQVVCIKI